VIEEWSEAEHASWYLSIADRFPHRKEGEAVVLEQIPQGVRRVLDLGTGDGRLLAMVLSVRPGASGVALDGSEPMLEAAAARFAGNDAVEMVAHDMTRPLPDLGTFDAVVSSFAIHHLEHERKLQLYAEIFRLLQPGGVFCNLEHVSSPTPELHARWRRSLGIDGEQEDVSNRCLDVQTQLDWLREIGFADVDCYWKWMEMALLCGFR
jgi:ubiquinone/menaquinone biosynthesis C-methylase UbiE